MSEFIELTARVSGHKRFIRLSAISAISVEVENGVTHTAVYLRGDEIPFKVREAYDDIKRELLVFEGKGAP